MYCCTPKQRVRTIFENLESGSAKYVQIKFLAMHVSNQKISFDIFVVGNLLNIFMEHEVA